MLILMTESLKLDAERKKVLQLKLRKGMRTQDLGMLR